VTKLLARRAAIALVVLAFVVSGCGKSHKSAQSSVSSDTSVTAAATTTGASSSDAVATPTPESSDPDVVGANIDASLNDINSDLSAIDSAPSDEGDPTQ
jgi:hypothetical protein